MTEEILSRLYKLRQETGFGRRRLADALSQEFGVRISQKQVRRALERMPEYEVSSQVESDIAEERLRLQASHYKSLYESLKRRTAQTELLSETIREAAASLPPLPPLTHTPVPPGQSSEEFVLLLSDQQLGQHTDPEETGGLGDYSIEIFHRYLQTLTDKVLDIWNLQRRPRKLHVWFLGDTVDGDAIFPGHQLHIEASVVEQVLVGAEAFSQFIQALKQHIPEISVMGIVGNHGRIGKKGERKPWESFDYLTYQFMQERLREVQGITWDIPKAWFSIQNVLGWNFLCVHGDDIRAWNGIPFYGADRADARWTKLLASKGAYYQYFVLAHHHQPAIWDSVGGEKIMNGPWPNGSQFSFKALNVGTRPSQYLFGVHRDIGRSWSYKLYLDSAPPKTLAPTN